ncbi:MAG: hypothetical protein AABZ08_00760 [Planctomycetota bacterium]
MKQYVNKKPRTRPAFGAFFLSLLLVSFALCIGAAACQKDQKMRDRHEEILRQEEE